MKHESNERRLNTCKTLGSAMFPRKLVWSFLSLFFLLNITALYAQQENSVRGTVTDPSGTPMPGVTVVVKGTTNGTVTDTNGTYRLSNVSEEATIVFSFVGMRSNEIEYSNQSTLDMVMEEETIGLDEVVAIGYGTMKRSDLTGSVAQVSSDVIRTQSVAKDPIQFLQGKIPGLDITAGNKPGDTSVPIIRGYNSLNASNSPLIILDGSPFEGRLSDINSFEIENINVLKDASSTAIYGSRGANGVIIITTKRGTLEKNVSFMYDGYGGITKSFSRYDLMDGDTWVNFRRTANYGRTDSELFDVEEQNIIQNKNYTDWQELLLSGTGYETNHNFSINMSNTNMSNMIVLGYNRNQSIIENMAFERFSARINGDLKLTENLSIGHTVMGTHSIRDLGSNSIFSQGLFLNPVTRAYDDNGDKLFFPSSFSEAYMQSNPLFDMDSEHLDNQSKRERMFINLFVNWEIITGLKFRSSLTTDWEFVENGSYHSPQTNARLNGTNSVSFAKSTSRNLTFTNILNYNTIIGKHTIDASIVNDMQRYNTNQIGLTGQDISYYGKWYNVDEAPDYFNRTSSYSEWALLSYMGRINYTFNDRYLFTFTGRSDGSSRLAEENKWDFFPSAAFAWRVSSEPFMSQSSTISNLKLRLSWGNTGNTAISPYGTQGALGRYTYVFGPNDDAALGYLPSELPNINLGWERTEEVNIGLDVGMLNNRISAAIDVYRRNTHDLLMRRNLPITSGYSSTWQNVGKTRNSGVEVALNTIPIATKDFEWKLDITLAYNKNEIVELYNGKEDDPGNKWFIGYPLNVEWLYEFDGIWQADQAQEASIFGAKPGELRLVDKNNNEIYDQEDLVLHNTIPKWTGGVSSYFRLKNFDLNIFVYSRLDYMRNIASVYGGYSASSARLNHLDVDFWTPNNPSNTFPIPVNSNPDRHIEESDFLLRDLSFVRLKNVNLGYTFSNDLLRSIRATNLRLYVAVDNPYTWTLNKFEGLDPENSSRGDHPPMTSFLIGINANF